MPERPEDLSPPPQRYAYVMLCMLRDAYAPGVIAMAESIRLSESPHDIVCMCTPDVSEQARAAIATVARVVAIEYVRYDTKRMKTQRQMELYGAWLNEAYTKWRCLELTEYTKVLFVDADMIVVNNIDHLFTLQAPAGTFSTPWAKEYAPESCFDLRGYPREHGAPVPAKTIMDTFKRGNGYTMIASMVLLEPNQAEFEGLCELVREHQPFGYNNWSTPDEQSITIYYAGRGHTWHHIHQKYNFIITKPQWLTHKTNGQTRCTVPHVLHYFADKKPWTMRNSFNESPFQTDAVFWWVLRQWWLRTGIELDLARFDEMKASTKITLRNSGLTQVHFPWLAALRVPFPALF